jgi:hypothetical protein
MTATSLAVAWTDAFFGCAQSGRGTKEICSDFASATRSPRVDTETDLYPKLLDKRISVVALLVKEWPFIFGVCEFL